MGFRPYVSLVGSFAKYLTNVHSSSCHVSGLDRFLRLLADEARRGEGRGVLTYANHISVIDDPAVWGCMPMSSFQHSASTRWTLGASDILFTNAFTKLLFSSGQVISTNRGGGIFQTGLDVAIEKLDQGQWVHLFPEGYVNLSRKMVLRRFKWGISRLLLESRRRPRVVPIWIEGFDQLMPDPRRFPRFLPRPFANLSITFGEPIDRIGSPLDALLSELRKLSLLNPAHSQDEPEEIERIHSLLPKDSHPYNEAAEIPVPSPASFPPVNPLTVPSDGWPEPPKDSAAYRALIANGKDSKNALAARSSLAELLRRELAALGVKARRSRGEDPGEVGRLVHGLMPEGGQMVEAQIPQRASSSMSTSHVRKFSTSALQSSQSGSDGSPPPSNAGSSSLKSGPDVFNVFTCRAPRVTTVDHSSASSSLTGWTVSIKDNICTRNLPTTASSRMLKDFQPSYDATVVNLLKSAGVQIIGKTNCDEFGMGSGNVHSDFGSVINPAMGVQEEDQNKWRSAGGSSGGAAASVKAGYCRIAIGSDTGGSIRLPASYCGLWGLKPSYGLISRWGLISYADSLDTIGVLANTWSDCAETFNLLSSYDVKDPTSLGEEVRKAARGIAEGALGQISTNSLRGLRIGVPSTLFADSLDAQILPSFSRLLHHLQEDHGATILPVKLPSTGLALSAYYVIASAEASSNLARYDGVRFGYRSEENRREGEHPYSATRSGGFGAEVKKRILLGTHALSADAFDNTFLAAQQIRQNIKKEFDGIFRIPNVLQNDDMTQNSSSLEGVDILLHPSAISTAPLLASLCKPDVSVSSSSSSSSSVEMKEYVQDLLTVPSSLAGLPSLSMPLGKGEEDGWPVGIMATSQWGMEPLIARLAEALQDYEVR